MYTERCPPDITEFLCLAVDVHTSNVTSRATVSGHSTAWTAHTIRGLCGVDQDYPTNIFGWLEENVALLFLNSDSLQKEYKDTSHHILL